MADEYHSLMKNDAWILVPQPQGKNIVKCHWVYKTKFTSKGIDERHKEHLIAKAFLSRKASAIPRHLHQLQR